MDKINKLPKTETPCYGCMDRVAGCHSECQKYKDFQAKHEAVKRKWDYENAAHLYEVQRRQSLGLKCGKGRQP